MFSYGFCNMFNQYIVLNNQDICVLDYNESNTVELEALWDSWVQHLPHFLHSHVQRLEFLFTALAHPMLAFVSQLVTGALRPVHLFLWNQRTQ